MYIYIYIYIYHNKFLKLQLLRDTLCYYFIQYMHTVLFFTHMFIQDAKLRLENGSLFFWERGDLKRKWQAGESFSWGVSGVQPPEKLTNLDLVNAWILPFWLL